MHQQPEHFDQYDGAADSFFTHNFVQHIEAELPAIGKAMRKTLETFLVYRPAELLC